MKRLPICLYAALFICTFGLQSLAAPEFKIITLQHRFAEDILPSIQALVTGDGTVSAMQNHLIIRTSAENMAELEQIIATLDVARPNFKITIHRQNNQNNTSDSVGVSGSKRFGDIEVSANNNTRKIKNGAHIDINSNQNNVESISNQFINVTDGGRAFIQVGQSIPFTQEWVTLTHRHISKQRSIEFVDISTGFAVRPRSVGRQIEMEITPRIAQLNKNGFIDFEELTTVILVNRGEWIDLGGIMLQRDDVSRAILSWGHGKQSLNNQLKIQVE